MIDNLFKITALIVGTSSTIQSNYIDILELIAMIKFNTYFFFFFFLYIQFTLFRTKNLQSPGTYISKRTWDLSQKAIKK